MSDEITPETPEPQSEPIEQPEVPETSPEQPEVPETPPEEPAEPAEPPADVLAEDTIVLPEPEPVVEPAPAPAPEPPPATLPAGSRVIAVVSRGPSPAPPAMPVGMPDVVGEKQGTALLRLQDIGLSVEVLHDHHPRLPRGYVIGQYPARGGSVHPGADAVLFVSSGKAQLPTPAVMLPGVVGLSHTMAADVLAAGGLVPRIVYDHDFVAPPGQVLAQIPSAESLAQPVRRRGGMTWIFAVVALVAIAIAAGTVWFLNRPMTIPNVIGLTQAQAQQSIALAGFDIGSVSASQTPNAGDIGNIVGQWPAPGGTAPHGSTINLTIAGGQLLVPVPNVTAQSGNAAQTALRAVGLVPALSQTFSSTVASGTVVSQAPAAGQGVPPGTKVGLAISIGQQSVTVPGVTGQPRTTAEITIKDAGLGVAHASNYDTTTPSGQVISQWPTAGTAIPPGTIVGLLVSRGVAPTSTAMATVPSTVGLSIAKAKSELSGVALKALVIQRSGTGRAKGEIIAQLPNSATVLATKSTVVLFASNGK